MIRMPADNCGGNQTACGHRRQIAGQLPIALRCANVASVLTLVFPMDVVGLQHAQSGGAPACTLGLTFTHEATSYSAGTSPHPQFSRMRTFVRANLDKRRIGMVEDLAHLPGGVGGHVDLVVGVVVAAGEADEFVDKSLDPFRRAR